MIQAPVSSQSGSAGRSGRRDRRPCRLGKNWRQARLVPDAIRVAHGLELVAIEIGVAVGDVLLEADAQDARPLVEAQQAEREADSARRFSRPPASTTA